jgi:hypothetical protein
MNGIPQSLVFSVLLFSTPFQLAVPGPRNSILNHNFTFIVKAFVRKWPGIPNGSGCGKCWLRFLVMLKLSFAYR